MATLAAFVFLGLISCLIYLDATALGRLNPDLYRTEMRKTPAFWAVTCFALLIVFAPAYFYFRYRFYRREAWAGGEFQPDPSIAAAARDFARVTGIVIVWFSVLQLYNLVLLPSLSFLTTQKFSLAQGNHLQIAGFITFGATIFLLRDRRRSVAETLYLKASRPTRLLVLIGSIALGFALAGALYAVQHGRSQLPSTPLTSALQTSAPSVLLQFVVIATLVGPFFEEIVYRGFIFDALARSWGNWVAAAVVAPVFALLHFEQTSGDWISQGAIVVVACGLTAVRAISRTVVPSTLAHYSYNIGLFLIPMGILWATNPSYAKFTALRDRLPVDERITLLRRSVAERPRNWSAHNALAWALAGENRELPEALKAIETALSGDPQNPAFRDTKAEVLFRLRRFEEAVAIEEALAAQVPERTFYREQLRKFQTARDAENAKAGADPGAPARELSEKSKGGSD